MIFFFFLSEMDSKERKRKIQKSYFLCGEEKYTLVKGEKKIII